MSVAEFDSRAFRAALGCFATGITVVTTRTPEGTPIGLTVNSFNSVSLEPPLVLWSLGLNSSYLEAFRQCSHYAVNVLAADQEAYSQRFAMMQGDRFADIAWTEGAGGAPLLTGCCATFEVANSNEYPGGDHALFVGRVENFSQDTDKEPLLYFGGAYRWLADKA